MLQAANIFHIKVLFFVVVVVLGGAEIIDLSFSGTTLAKIIHRIFPHVIISCIFPLGKVGTVWCVVLNLVCSCALTGIVLVLCADCGALLLPWLCEER